MQTNANETLEGTAPAQSRGLISMAPSSSQKPSILSKGWVPLNRQVGTLADLFRTPQSFGSVRWPRHLLLKESQLRLDSFSSHQRLLRSHSSHTVA